MKFLMYRLGAVFELFRMSSLAFKVALCITCLYNMVTGMLRTVCFCVYRCMCVPRLLHGNITCVRKFNIQLINYTD